MNQYFSEMSACLIQFRPPQQNWTPATETAVWIDHNVLHNESKGAVCRSWTLVGWTRQLLSEVAFVFVLPRKLYYFLYRPFYCYTFSKYSGRLPINHLNSKCTYHNVFVLLYILVYIFSVVSVCNDTLVNVESCNC